MNMSLISFQENLYEDVEQLNLDVVINYIKEGFF